MRYTEFTMDGKRYVAFGTFLRYQNVHRIEDGHIVQLMRFFPATTKFARNVEITSEGEATAAPARWWRRDNPDEPSAREWLAAARAALEFAHRQP